MPNPNNEDTGFFPFMDTVDALIMGRTTFETVVGFDVPWPYTKPVFVLSNRLNEIPKSHTGKAFLVKGTLKDVVKEIHDKGFHHLYIDGETTISNFLKEDLIDEKNNCPLFLMLSKELLEKVAKIYNEKRPHISNHFLTPQMKCTSKEC